jgi:putative phage-type endonuclease
MIDRKTYLGSGDIAAVAGVSPYRSALEVWAEKVGLAESQPDNPRMQAGRTLERPILALLYAEPRGYQLAPPLTEPILGAGSDTWLGATPDAIVRHEGAAPWLAECKLVGARSMGRWGEEAEGVEGVPPDVLVQVQWQLLVTGYERCDVAALLGGTDFRLYPVPRMPDMIADLAAIGLRFWRENVQARVAPEITEAHADRARDLIAQLYPRQRSEELLDMTPDVRALAEQYLAARAYEDDAKKQKERAAAMLCAAIGEHAGFKAPDLRATWKATEGGTPKWKEIALAAGATPELIAAHTPSGSRRLDVRELTRR